MFIRTRGRRLAALGAVGALILAGCSSGDGGGDAPDGGRFSVGSEVPESMLPSDCYDLYCANILRVVFTGLFDFETEGASMRPVHTALTKSVTPSADGKTYTIAINPGNTFTNGEAVTAQTFVDTWNFAANAGNGQQLGFIFGPAQLNVVGYDDAAEEGATDVKMEGLRAVDENTIEVKLVEPMGQTLFENYLAGPQIYPMPSVAFTDITEYNKLPIGNGPYKFTAAWGNTGAELERNPDYSYTPGKAGQVSFKFYADQNTEWADLQSNALDVIFNMPTGALSQAAGALGDRFINNVGMSFSYEAFPTQVKAFAERDVRVAIAKAVDWKQISDTFYYGTRVAATGFAPPSVPGGGRDICGEDCTYDPAAAKKLLDDAGGIPGNKIYLTGYSNQGNEAVTAECNMIQQNLGVTCEVRIFESFGAAVQAFRSLTSDDEGLIIGLGWGADNPTLANMIAPTFGTDGGNNRTGYSNADFDRLIAEGNQAPEEATSIEKWQAAEEVVYEDFAGHAIQWRNNVGGYSTNVTNVTINPGQFLNTETIEVIGSN